MSIYESEEKNSPAAMAVPVADSDVGTGGLRQGLFGGDAGSSSRTQEESEDAVVPGDDGPDSVATAITDFKAKREHRERLALGVLLNIMLVVIVTTQVFSQWILHDVNPATNPFREAMNGTATAALTEVGRAVYTDVYAAQRWVQACIVSMPLDLEAIASDFRWGSGILAGKRPSLASACLWGIFSTIDVVGCYTNGTKYGWPSVFLQLAVFFRYMIFGRLQFAREPQDPGERNPLLRQPTLIEHIVMERIAWSLGDYIAFDMYCIHDGQWDGKTTGKFGGLLMVFLELAILAPWWLVWGQHVFQAGAPAGMDRGTLCTNAYLGILLTINWQQGLHYLFLLPDQPDNAELVTMNGKGTNVWLSLAYTQAFPLLCFFFFREQIFSVLKAPLRKKQRLQDGAFMAALLADDEDIGAMISEASLLFRGIPFSKLSAEVFRSSKATPEEFALSHPCKLNAVDFFISHSWSDDHEQKYANICVAAAEFERKHGREPIMWLDKVCLDLSAESGLGVESALKYLPVFVLGCRRLLIVAGNTYYNRLWCVWELYVFFSATGQPLKRIDLVDFSDSGVSTLLTFDVANAHCFDPTDETKLRAIIDSEGAGTFSKMVQQVGAELYKVQSTWKPPALPV